MAHINDASDRLAVYPTGDSTQQGLYELMWCEPYRNAPCPGVASIGLLVEAIARRHLVEAMDPLHCGQQFERDPLCHRPGPSARSRLNAALTSARCVKA